MDDDEFISDGWVIKKSELKARPRITITRLDFHPCYFEGIGCYDRCSVNYPCGPAWSGRLPVTEKIACSNHVRGA